MRWLYVGALLGDHLGQFSHGEGLGNGLHCFIEIVDAVRCRESVYGRPLTPSCRILTVWLAGLHGDRRMFDQAVVPMTGTTESTSIAAVLV